MSDSGVGREQNGVELKTCLNCGNLLATPNWKAEGACLKIVIQGEVREGYAAIDMFNFGSVACCDDWVPRAERTCHPTEHFHDGSPWPAMVCSECGRPLHYDETGHDEDGEPLYEYAPYCCCGAKVV